MSYVKKYEVGSVRLDAPYAHYIYELPLLSFSDIRNSISLSLVYQSKLNDNPFYIKNGFKLNLQKRLIMAYGTYPKNYEDCDGTLVSLNNFVNHFTFNDDSQRIIRYINGQYVLENPDLSTEIYNSSGKIIAIKDKYGSEYLTYTYTSGKLTSINYRNSKYINLSYYTAGSYSGQLERIDFVCGETSVSSTFIYSNSGIKIQHYSGVDYHFVFSGNTLTSYSTDRNGAYSNTYSHKLTCTLNASNHQIVASAYIGEKEVDRNTYDCLGVNSQNKFMAVNTKDFNGVITRVQYENDKPRYSYEITDTADEPSYRDIFFEDTNSNFIYKGNVSINTDTFSGVQGVNSGCKMSNISIDNISCWEYIFSGTESLYGNFIISGWIYAEENATYTVTVKDIYRSVDYEGCTLSNLVPNVWNYFSFKTYMRNPADITVKITETSGFPFCFDVRISFEEGKIYTPTDYNNFTVTKDVLIKEGADSSNAKIIYFDNALRFYNGNKLITNKITASDILKYKINQNKNRYLDELCYDKCKGISTGNGVIYLEYDEDVNGVTQTTRINVNDIAVGKVHINNGKTYLTKMNFYTDSNGDDYFATVTYINSEEIGREIFDEYFDIASSTIDSVTTAYTRTNGLITSESVQNLYTRTTTYSEDAGGNPTITAKDEFNNTTIYTLDPVWGVVKSTLMPDGTTITDGYDSDMCTVVARTFTDSDGNSKTHSFDYAAGNLKELTDGTINYNFAYSAGALSEVFKFDTTPIEKHVLSNGDKTLSSYYPKESGALYSIVQNTDKYGRLTRIDGQISNTYDLDPTYSSNKYNTVNVDNSSGKLATSTDITTGKVTKYAYNKDRVSNIGVFNSEGTKISEETLEYDDAGRFTSDTYTYSCGTNISKSTNSVISYVKDASDPKADGRVLAYVYNLVKKEKDDKGDEAETVDKVATTLNTYDSFKRPLTKSTTLAVTPFSKTFTYDKNRLSSVSETYSDLNFGTDAFTYDTNGKITTHNYSSAYKSYNKSYVYDSFGQLVREDNKGLDKTFIYCYDNIGNITSVKTYAYTTADTPSGTYTTDSYTYDSAQKDRLTKYGYNNISYNAIGYPTSYGEKNLEWQNGRLTKYYDQEDEYGIYSRDIVDFTYNAYGQRTSKIYEYDPGPDYSGNFTIGVDTTYDYDSSGRLIREFRTEYFTESASLTHELIYLYDESGIIGLMYSRNGAAPQPYYYRRNPQGDVVAIYTECGHRKAEYAYDAFGNCKVIQNASDTDIAFINPIRYRGYYYDTETKLYYLNARYYNPEWRRFISPDSTEYIDSENPNGLNLYAYCCNDPVNYADPSGHEALPNWLKWVIGGVAFAGAVTLTALTGGALAPMFIQMGASIVLGGLIEGTVSAIRGENFWEGFANGAANGALTGGVLALGQSIFRVIKIANYASRGLTIGKKGTFEVVGKMTGTAHYGGLKSHGFLKKLFGTNFADKVGWIQNKSVIKGVMKFKGVIYDCGGELTGAYAKEIALTKGYEYFVNIWLL